MYKHVDEQIQSSAQPEYSLHRVKRFVTTVGTTLLQRCRYDILVALNGNILVLNNLGQCLT